MDKYSTPPELFTLRTLIQLSESNLDAFIKSGELRTYKKSHIIFRQNTPDSNEYFQLNGITHRFNTSEDGLNVSTGIYHGSKIITPQFARTENKKSIFSLQALVDTTCFVVPAEKFQELRNSIPEIWSLGQRVVETEFQELLNFEVLFRSNSAKTRLIYFRKKYKGLENEISHSIIASYLGITPVSFSRIRSELSKGDL